MNTKLMDDVLADAKAAIDDVSALSVDLRMGAQLRWQLFRAELEVFKLGLQRLGLLVPLLFLLALLAAMTLSVLLGYVIYALSGSPLLALILLVAIQAGLIVWLGGRAIATIRAMNFSGSRAHLMKLSRYVSE